MALKERHAHKHWGQWLWDRALIVGFRKKSELAASVGITPQHLSRLLARAKPPKEMRRGVDFALVRALETTDDFLFREFRSIAPQNAHAFELPRPGERPWNEASWEGLDIRSQLNVLLFYIGEASDRLVEYGIFLADAQEEKNRKALRELLPKSKQ